MMRVNGPNGLAVNFPDGTDPQTIDRVMREAMQKSGPDARIAGAFEASKSVAQKDPPETWRGTILPVSRDTQGGFHPAMPKLLQPLAQGAQAVGEVSRGAPITTETIDKTIPLAAAVIPLTPGMRAGEGWLGAPTAMRREKVAIPSSDELRAAGGAGYDAARAMGVDYDPRAVAKMASTLGAELERDGINSVVAPKSFRLLKLLQSPPPGAGASLAGMDTARKAFRNAAKDFANPTEQLAAQRVIDELDRFVEAPPAASVVAGPAAAAGATLKDARGNYATAMRSRMLAGKQDQAQLSAAAANSGANTDNALRQRIRDVLKSPKASAGFNEEELKAMRNFVLGDKSRNTLRIVSNVLGGGGGLGTVAAGMAGMGAGGYALGAPGAAAGVALPMIGWGAKKGENMLAKKGMKAIDEQVRMRSPLFQQRQAAAPVHPISPELRAALIRSLLMGSTIPPPPQGTGGGGY